MDKNLINKFRDKVNDSMIFRKYLIQQEPAHRPWNVICSAMDWIETAVVWFEQYEPRNFENEFIAGMNFSFYIVAVDTVLMGIEQLEHVFDAAGKDLNIKSERNSIRHKREGVFANLHGDKDNVSYFKNIRAIFSAHMIDLELPEGFFTGKDEENSKKVRCCASWSIHEWGVETVYLYRKQTEGTPVEFSVDRKELQLFAEKVYEELTEYLNAIDVIEAKCREKYKQQIIDRSGSKTDFINRLIKENYKRFGYDDYEWLLKKIRVILTSTRTEASVIELQKRAENLLQDIADAIQNAEYREFAAKLP